MFDVPPFPRSLGSNITPTQAVPSTPMSDDRPVDRRSFFLRGFRELLKPLAEAAAPIERALEQFDALDRGITPGQPAAAAATPSKPTTWNLPVLRPPGALPEREFRDTCSRCGTCVSVC